MVQNGLNAWVQKCNWVSTHGSCDKKVAGGEFIQHVQDCHGVTGPATSQYLCCWEGCHKRPMSRDILFRHLTEQHLRWRWPCFSCDQSFTRRSNMITHYERCRQRRVWNLPRHVISYSLAVIALNFTRSTQILLDQQRVYYIVLLTKIQVSISSLVFR